MAKDVSASQGPWHEGQQSSVAPGRSQPDVSPLPVVQGHSPEPVTAWDLSLQAETKTHTDEMAFLWHLPPPAPLPRTRPVISLRTHTTPNHV